MPPKAAKRALKTPTDNGDNGLVPPDKATWPGWVEMESEPAFFNVMLRDMGVRGVKINEVYCLDDDDLAILPQPVHALIFLFRYRETDKDDLPTECPSDVWYAEQVPEFSCATVALLNIINNIPGLEMGRDLRAFKDFTRDMTPNQRGEAIDDFAFVKKIHNSFAREADILQADVHMKEKAAKARKRQATAKAQKTRAENAARKAEQSLLPLDTPKTTRTSGRVRKLTTKTETAEDVQMRDDNSSSKHDSSPAVPPSSIDEATPPESIDGVDSETKESASIDTPTKPTANMGKKLKLNATKHDPNAEYAGAVENESEKPQPRRSARQPRPRKDVQPSAEFDLEADEEGFHFCAYMPIGDRVWKLDGMDKVPQDMGPIIPGIDWLSIAQPALQSRMAQYGANATEFSLMAVVHDPMVVAVEALAENIKALCAVEDKLGNVVEDWKEMLDEEEDEMLLHGEKLGLGVQNVDIARVELTQTHTKTLAEAEDLATLLEMRKELVLQQAGLRGACRDEMDSVRRDEEKAADRRHDFSKFVKEWVGVLIEKGQIDGLIERND